VKFDFRGVLAALVAVVVFLRLNRVATNSWTVALALQGTQL